MPPQVTVTYVAQQGQQKEEGCTFISPADYTCYCLCVDGVGGKEQPCQQAPQASAEQQSGQGGKQACHSSVEGYVNKVVTPWLQPTQDVVEAEGQRAEGPVRLVTATVCE